MKQFMKIIKKKSFVNFILGVIIFNTVLMGISTIKSLSDTMKDILNYIDMACLFIYVVEMVLKMLAYNFFGYFKSAWNCFDFFIIIISVLSVFSIGSSLQVLRSLRVFRSLRSLRGFKMISSIDELQRIISGIGKSLPGISWTAFLMVLIYYIFSIIGVSEFGDEFPDWFGTIPKTMYTLFQVMTLESWSMGISRPVMERFRFAWLYFIPFVVISSFITMNVVVGIVVNSISEVAENKEKIIEAKSIEICKTENIKFEIEQMREHLCNLDDLIKKGKFIPLEQLNNNDYSVKVNQINQDEN
ncbi:hypothetical protein PIROE2DRAFT_56838 [Piromyces sp. E2]|nr:hypothetical protein PIROE2DRAFT_56838 [Piromyces sp. E2]|eukprot:OUM70333.1 hypothetical protein PIROE2DRAFT_56838 [Piromyces sp. E2]